MNPRKPRRVRINQTNSTDQPDQNPTDSRFMGTKFSEASFRKQSPPRQMSPKQQESTHVPLHFTEAQEEALKQKRAHHVNYDSSESSLSDSSSSFQPYSQRTQVVDSFVAHANVLPTVMRYSAQEEESFELPEVPDGKSKRFSQMGFSFRPGDDMNLASLAGKLSWQASRRGSDRTC